MCVCQGQLVTILTVLQYGMWLNEYGQAFLQYLGLQVIINYCRLDPPLDSGCTSCLFVP